MRLNGRDVVVLAATLVVAATTARLGFWQLDRADQKIRAQQAQVERRALPLLPAGELARDSERALRQQHRLVELQGHWRPELTVYLDNRQMDGHPGFFAVTPLVLDDGTAVLVQRGWLPRDFADRTRIAAPPPPAGPVTVQGRIALDLARMFEFSGAASGTIRQNLDLESYAQETALNLRPLALVQQDGPAAPQDGLKRHWLEPAADVHKHYGYAFQWFAFSGLSIVLYVWFKVIRPRRQRRA